MIEISDSKYKLSGMNRLLIPFSLVHLTISAIPSTLITSCTTRIDSTDWIDFLKLAIAKFQVDIRAPIDFYASTNVARWLYANDVGGDDENSGAFSRGWPGISRGSLDFRHAQLNSQFFIYNITCK